MQLIPGNVIRPIEGIDGSILNESVRILRIDKTRDQLIAIPVEPQRSSGRLYFRLYKVFSYKQFKRYIDSPNLQLKVIGFKRRKIQLFSDDDIAIRLKQSIDSCYMLKKRDERWALIEPLLDCLNNSEKFNRSKLSKKIDEYINDSHPEKNFDTTKIEIRNLLSQYWACGAEKNALLPFTECCGGKGKEKTFKGEANGRKNMPTLAGIQGQQCPVIMDEHKSNIVHAWTHFLRRGVTIACAYRRMCAEFYCEYEVDKNGSLITKELPTSSIPTEAQFRNWGKKLTNKTASILQSAPNQYVHSERPLPGRANDGITAVGQCGAVDSTTTDVNLVSIDNRLEKIGFANRILLVDLKHNYIAGFYMGLKASSSETVKLALLHAISDKADWLEHLDLADECPSKDWLPMQFANLRADNTEARTIEIIKTILETGAIQGIDYVPKNRSDQNSVVETTHKKLHRMVDHLMPGTTYGRHLQRGEADPVLGARLNTLEAIREVAKAIHTHNTIEMDSEVLTMDMRRDGVKPTRLDMTRWEIEQGKIATSVMDIDEARMILLPIYSGVFTKSGVKIFKPDNGNKNEYIKRLNYISDDKPILDLMSAARVNGNRTANFRVDPYNLKKIWYVDIHTGTLFTLHLQSNDETLANEYTLFDLTALQKQEQIENFFHRQSIQSSLSDLEQHIEETSKKAEADYQNEISTLDKTPTKTELRGNRRENRENELQKNNVLQGIPVVIPNNDDKEEVELCIDEVALEKEVSNPTTIFDEALRGLDDE